MSAPLKNDGVRQLDDDIPNIWKNNPNVPTTNQRFKAFTIEKNRWISQMARFGYPFVAYPYGSMATVWEGTANPLNHTPVPIPKKVLGSIQCGAPVR